MTERMGPILLVEDSQDDEELALLALSRVSAGYPVRVARDGQEALDYLFGSDGPAMRPLPVFVLLDLKLPKIDGFEVLRRLRRETRTRTLPVVILSSSNVREDVVRAFELGVNSYVQKPVEFSRYSEAIERVGRYWLHLDEHASLSDEPEGAV